jgi:RNA polymerase sigma factor (sigma-70 family)
MQEGSQQSGAILFVGGIQVEEASFIEALRRRDLEAERRLVQQLREDFRNVDRSPRGLLLLQRAFRGSIVGWLQRDLLRGDLQTAEEAWNDALFRVWSRIEQYDEDRSRFLTWVWSQARWAALDLKRKSEARRDIPYAGEERAAEPEGGDEGIDLLARSLEKEAARWVDEPEPATRFEERAIKRALDRVTETEQWLLRLRYVHGFRNVDIARKGLLEHPLPEEHVRVYVNRAAKRLRKYYEEELRIETAREGGEGR